MGSPRYCLVCSPYRMHTVTFCIPARSNQERNANGWKELNAYKLTKTKWILKYFLVDSWSLDECSWAMATVYLLTCCISANAAFVRTLTDARALTHMQWKSRDKTQNKQNGFNKYFSLFILVDGSGAINKNG